MEFYIRAFTLSLLVSIIFAALVWQIVQDMTEDSSGGIPEEEAEDER